MTEQTLNLIAFERIKNLADKQGVSLQTVSIAVGLSDNYIYNLRTRKSSSSEAITKIADYFRVSTDYIYGRTDNPRIASDEVTGYSTEDLRKMAENAKTFDGKPLTEDDINAIQNIIEIYLKGR
ncbi:helix-turn-helix domain-containing protein [Streptococcus agalactiae]|nr:helix-turn-helix transcriptional regulator [Streptococcus agalactiae]HEN6661727.1 helix-turn-helix transcriptional regulator [Streptococcus agalactiae]HEN7501302.1 helix-turn-helix transcriptional regulator [Streptococcus agalactiae]HEN7654470.1 helix-turn-helix transcriptional regulator [Streptococcus agalactiae]HEO6815343.1 helix-turn-helix transcriptional regulator [Streptococcus agalactiae]